MEIKKLKESSEDSDEEVLQVDPDLVKEQKSIQKQTRFNIEKILKSLDKYDCFEDKKGKIPQREFLELTYCLSKLENYIFKPNNGLSLNSLTNRLNNFVYLPLAMNSKKISNTTSNLVNLLLDTSKQQFIPKMNYSTDFEDFQDSIMKNFNEGMDKVKDKDWYKGISENWT